MYWVDENSQQVPQVERIPSRPSKGRGQYLSAVPPVFWQIRQTHTLPPRGYDQTKAIKSYHWINNTLLCFITKAIIPCLVMKKEKLLHTQLKWQWRCSAEKMITFQLAVTPWVHRAVLCMLMQDVRTEPGFKGWGWWARRGPEAITLPQRFGQTQQLWARAVRFMSFSSIKDAWNVIGISGVWNMWTGFINIWNKFSLKMKNSTRLFHFSCFLMQCRVSTGKLITNSRISTNQQNTKVHQDDSAHTGTEQLVTVTVTNQLFVLVHKEVIKCNKDLYNSMQSCN